MNPDSEIYRLRGLVCQNADIQFKFALRQNHDHERALTFDKVEGQLFLLYHHFWQKDSRIDAHDARPGNLGREFGTSAWMDNTTSHFF